MKITIYVKYLFLSSVFLLFSVLVFLFLYKSIDSNNKTSRQIQEELQIQAIKQNEINSLEYLLKNISKEKVLLDTHFANSLDIISFLDFIEALSLQVSVKAEVFSVEQSIKQKEDQIALKKETLSADASLGDTRPIISMRVLGDFESIYKFITLLENAPYELEIIFFDLQREMGKNTNNTNIEIPKWNGVLKVKFISFI